MSDQLQVRYPIETEVEDWLLQFNYDQKEAVRWFCSQLAGQELSVLRVPEFIGKHSEIKSLTDLVMTFYKWYHAREVQRTHQEETGEHPFEWEVDMNHAFVQQLMDGFGSEITTEIVNAVRKFSEPSETAVLSDVPESSEQPHFRRVDHLLGPRRPK